MGVNVFVHSSSKCNQKTEKTRIRTDEERKLAAVVREGETEKYDLRNGELMVSS